MKRFLKIPLMTGSLLLALTQPSLAQTSGKDTEAPQGAGTRTPAGTGTATGTDTNTNRGTNRDTATGTSVGNHSDTSGGTTNTGNRQDTTRSARQCADNENYVRQGDRMVCVPRASSDHENSTGTGQDTIRPESPGTDNP
ncbi:hypothetical protein [Oligoflexus tunisiensis]|uniref:hypothetical protein n=1 Tax=Oligoflexus tunisiensis TaxID=708132 RepID=UPI000B13A60E|nr:hypothetical protein [Oligoflexus tunisiensis]